MFGVSFLLNILMNTIIIPFCFFRSDFYFNGDRLVFFNILWNKQELCCFWIIFSFNLKDGFS